MYTLEIRAFTFLQLQCECGKDLKVVGKVTGRKIRYFSTDDVVCLRVSACEHCKEEAYM